MTSRFTRYFTPGICLEVPIVYRNAIFHVQDGAVIRVMSINYSIIGPAKIAVTYSRAADSAINGHNPAQRYIFNGRDICIQQLSQVCKQTTALPVLGRRRRKRKRSAACYLFRIPPFPIVPVYKYIILVNSAVILNFLVRVAAVYGASARAQPEPAPASFDFIKFFA